MNSTQPPSSLGVLYVLLGCLFFSAGSVVIKAAGSRLPAMEIVFARSAFMFFYCLLLARRAGAFIPGHDRLFLTLRGLLGFAAYFCTFYAVIHLPLADALVLIFAYPLIVPFLGALFLKEPMERIALVCAVLGIIGMLCVSRPSFLFDITSDLDPMAVILAIAAAIMSAFSVICIRRLTTTEHPLVIVLYAAMTSCIGAPLLDGWNWLLPTGTEFLMLAGLGLFMSLGQHMLTLGFTMCTAARVSVFMYSEVVFAALFGYLFFGEIPDSMTITGVLIILGGAVALAVSRQKLP